jgi:hypothetical protein
VNGGWRDDEEFSECNAKCNGGNKTKTKYCDKPPPSNDGQNCTCSGDETEINCDGITATIQETCNKHACPGEHNFILIFNDTNTF